MSDSDIHYEYGLNMNNDNHKPDDQDQDNELHDDEYREIFAAKKQELLLDNRRARVTTMSFNDWFVKTYKRQYKQADHFISEAYHAGAADEIENNEYLMEHTELKMQHYKNKAVKQSDDLQILYSLLDTIARKVPALPEALKKLVKKTLNDLL